MGAKGVETLEDLCKYIEEYSKTIYVREQLNGVWCSVAMGDLPGHLAIKHAMRLITAGRVPCRLRDVLDEQLVEQVQEALAKLGREAK